ncbi:helix-turn-helix domain-containing protein [Streptomyces sp. NPDC005931]|uniref:helix-turn-helix domain-containing protein n=1 Tax=Streptomyces sp. NPDC005931 TaxID=3364737 RepID=UPI00369B7433
MRRSLEESLGRAVRRRREEVGLTQVSLAARAGLTQAAVSRLERGRCMPTLPMLERIAEAFGAVLHVAVQPGRGVTIAFLDLDVPRAAVSADNATAPTGRASRQAPAPNLGVRPALNRARPRRSQGSHPAA